MTTTYDNTEKIWLAPKRARLFDPNCSLGRAALYMMRSKPPNTVCQISDSESTTLTFDTASTYAIRIAKHLKEAGITQDDVVGFVSPNTTLLMPVVVGCWLNCTPIHAVSPTYDEDTIKHLYTITTPKIIFLDGVYYEKLKNATSEWPVKFYTLCNHLDDVESVEKLLAPTETEQYYQAEPLRYGPEQTMAIYCTSGTTGAPKAACISNARLSIDFGLVNGSSTFFSFSTVDWGTGILNIIYNILAGGTRIITSNPFTAEYNLEIITKYKVNFFSAVPEHMSAFIHSPAFTNEAMQSVKYIYMTGAPCTANTLLRLRASLTNGLLIYGYGCTECGGIATTFTSNKLMSMGQLLPNVQLKIVDVESRKRLGPQEVGEICVRNDYKWLGYYHNAKATAEAFDAEGWIRTGDLGYMDAEQSLFIVDRCKNILKYHGKHYSPSEIEQTIAELPSVRDVCVFGIFNENHGDLAAAAIVPTAGATLTATEVIEYVAKKQKSKHKQLNYGVFFVESLPRNTNGKMLHQKVKKQCLASETIEKLSD